MFDALKSLWRNLLRRAEVERELDDELQSCLQMLVDEKRAVGLDEAEARRQARLELGGIEQVKEAVRGVRRGSLLEMIGQEFRLAARRLRRRPAFSLVAALTLALGIGASTAIFSVIDGVLLKPLPYPHSDRLVWVGHSTSSSESPGWIGLSTGSVHVYQERTRTLQQLAAYSRWPLNLSGRGQPERVAAAQVTPNFFAVLGVSPLKGRLLSEQDGRSGAPLVALISYGLWQRRFGGDAGVLGQSITIHSRPAEIVGVMPEEVRFPDDDTQLWMPLGLDPAQGRSVNFYLRGLGLLAEGSSAVEAQAELDGFFDSVFERYPGEATASELRGYGFEASVRPLKESIVGNIGEILWVLMAAVGLILLIACANVANLFLVQSEQRDRELGIRGALGAGRLRLSGHLMSESLLLGVAGGLLGLALSQAGLRLMLWGGQIQLPRLHEVGADLRVLAFATGAALLTVLLFGALPVLRLRTLRAMMPALKEGGRGIGGKREGQRTRKALVVCQLALALILLAGSGLMLRTFWNLRAVDPGFPTENLLLFQLDLPSRDYPTPHSMVDFHLRVLDELRALPQAEAASAAVAGSYGLPFEKAGNPNPLWIEDFPTPPGSFPDFHSLRIILPGYFHTLGIPIVEGRAIERRDLEQGSGAVVVGQSFARRYWPQGSAVGKRLRPLPEWPWYTIVGVAAEVRGAGLGQDPVRAVYWGIQGAERQYYTAPATMSYAVRTRGEPSAALPAVRRAIDALDPGLPLANVRTMRDEVARSMERISFTMTLLGIAGVMALALASVGIYGAMSYLVARRTHEIGVRMALGARAWEVLGMVLRQGLALIAAGLVLGILGAAAATRLLESLLFGVRPTDALTFGLVSVVLALVALLANLQPARRAASVEPVEALRFE